MKRGNREVVRTANRTMTASELIDLKKRMEDANAKVHELNGKMSAIMERLKTQYGCNSVEEAESKLSSIEENIKSAKDELEALCVEISERLDECERI